jgi:hypothetical protein
MSKCRFDDLEKKKPSPVGGQTAFNETVIASSNNEGSLTQSTKKSSSRKKRNWACVIYPESLPKDWLDILRATGLQIAISPLHDKDLEADEQTPKKSHYHVILVYAGPTSFSVVKNLTDKLNAPIPVPLEAVRGYYRYFTHKDNPEKYQYDEKDIQCLNGFSILDFVELTKTEVNEIKKSLQVLIRTQDMHEYCVFMDYVLENLSDSEYDVASGHTYFFDKYLSSRRFSSSKNLALEALTNQE